MSHWIDMHSHILPGMDDGAPTDEVAINMAIAAMRDGVDAVIATPHHANGIYENEAPAIMRAVDRLNELLQQRGISLQVLPGQEIRIHDRLLDDLAQMKLMGLNRTRYLLVEFPYGHLPSASEDLFHELLVQDYVPVIAHPERGAFIQSRYFGPFHCDGRLEPGHLPFAERGIRFQSPKKRLRDVPEKTLPFCRFGRAQRWFPYDRAS